jgi:hypothetical protein
MQQLQKRFPGIMLLSQMQLLPLLIRQAGGKLFPLTRRLFQRGVNLRVCGGGYSQSALKQGRVCQFHRVSAAAM